MKKDKKIKEPKLADKKDKKQKVKEEKINKVKEKKEKRHYFKDLKAELKKVTWPAKKEVFKYSVATLIFCTIVVAFFQILNLGLSLVKGVFN